jgi:outer membrane cobalamin receptor
VVVTSRKLPVQTFIDRKVYMVTEDLQASFGVLSDVLNDIPAVNVDMDGNLTLRGDSHVLILVDGRPSPLFSGSSAGDKLQSFPAADIERIEVITTPPPQYRAAGAAGVINIITRKTHKEGTTGSVRASQGNDGRSVAGADWSYRSGKLSTSVAVGFRHDERQKLLESDVRSPLTPAADTLETRSVLLEQSRRSVPSARVHAEYALDEKNSVTNSFSWLRYGGPRNYSQTTTTADAAGTVTSASERLSRGHDPETDYDQRLEYSRKLARPGEELHISLHRGTSHHLKRYDYTDETLLPVAAPDDSYLIQSEHDASSEVGLDYVLPFSGARVLKLGYLFEQDDYSFGSTAAVEDPVTAGSQTFDPTGTDDFRYRRRINAGYASYQASSGPWSFLMGLRLEDTSTGTRLLTADTASPSHDLGLFPSLHVERSLSDAGTVSFGASRRVTRPDPYQLDPSVNHEYTLIERAGNVHLLPGYTQSYELGYGLQGHDLAWQLTGYYRRNHDASAAVTKYLGNGVLLSTQENLPRDDFEGLELTADGHFGPRLSLSVSANLYQNQVDASALGIPGLRSTRGVDAKLKLDYRATAWDAAQLSINRTDRQLGAQQGYGVAVNVVNAGYRHKLRADLAALATVSDLFNGQRTEGFLTTPSFTSELVRSIRGPFVYVGLIYSFGSPTAKEPDFQYEH